MANVATAVIMTTFSPISTVVAEVYEINVNLVNSCYTLYFISFIVFNFISVWFIEKYGLNLTVST